MAANGQIVADRINPNDFYYHVGTNLYFSNNGGVSFTLVSSAVPSGGGLVANPFTSGDLWLAVNGGLYHSTNFGTSFTKVTSSLTSTNGVMALGAPAPGQTTPAIYVFGTIGGFLGVNRSDDGGTTWTQAQRCQPSMGRIAPDLAADPMCLDASTSESTAAASSWAIPPAPCQLVGPISTLIIRAIRAGRRSPPLSPTEQTVNQWILNGGGDWPRWQQHINLFANLYPTHPGQFYVTAVTSTPHDLHVGDTVTIAGASPAGFNGTYAVASVVNSTTFTYYVVPGASTATGSISASTKGSFNFAYQSVTGNSKLTAQLQSLTNADGAVDNPQAGVMFRAGTSATDVFAALVQSTDGQLALQYRTTTGGAVSTVSLGSIPVGSEYMQLVRTGNDFAAFYSADGVSWTQLGATTTIASMPLTADGGLVATANFNSQLTSATFANVLVRLQGDVNLDGHVNSTDVGALMQALSDQDAYQTANNLSQADATYVLDVNGNGTLNFGDLQYLLNLLNSGGGSLAESAPSSTGSASIPVSTLLPSSSPTGNSDSSSAASTITFAVVPTTSSTASNSKTLVANTSGTSNSATTKKISLATVDQFFNRFDLHGASKRALKQTAHDTQQDSLTDALLGSKDFTV